jgi:hypothetical protein
MEFDQFLFHLEKLHIQLVDLVRSFFQQTLQRLHFLVFFLKLAAQFADYALKLGLFLAIKLLSSRPCLYFTFTTLPSTFISSYQV